MKNEQTALYKKNIQIVSKYEKVSDLICHPPERLKLKRPTAPSGVERVKSLGCLYPAVCGLELGTSTAVSTKPERRYTQ